MRQFYIAHLLDSDGGRLASEEVWSPDPGSEYYPEGYDLAVEMAPENVVHDACAFFSSDDNGALDLGDTMIALYGPFTVDEGTPQAMFSIAEPAPDSTDIYTATRVGGVPAPDLSALLSIITDFPADANSEPDVMAWALDAIQTLATRLQRGETVDLTYIAGKLGSLADTDDDDANARDLIRADVAAAVSGMLG